MSEYALPISKEEFTEVISTIAEKYGVKLVETRFTEDFWDAILEYRKVEFLIRIPLKLLPSPNKIGFHLVLEETEKSHKIAKEIRRIFDYDSFLWEDTLHYGMEEWEFQDMVKYLISEAKHQIDWLKEKAFHRLLDKFTEEIKQFLENKNTLLKIIRELQ